QQLLDANGKKNFFDFAHQRAFRTEEEVSRQLLSNGTCPLGSVTRKQRNAGGTEDPYGVNTVMLIKSAVFGRNKGFDHFWWHLIQRHRNTTFLAILRDKLAISAVNLHWDLQTHIFQRRDIRQLWLDIA